MPLRARSRGRRLYPAILFVFAGFDPLAPGQIPSATTLRSAESVHRLSLTEAQQNLPVELVAVVTHFHRRLGDGFFVQDETGGVYVRLHGETIDVPTGERVRIVGVTSPGDFAPVVTIHSCERLGPAPLPSAPIVGAGGLSSGRHDSTRVRIRGVVTAAIPVERTNVPHLALQVRVDDTTILAGVNLYSDASLRLADAEVEITGVAGGLFSRQRQLLRGVLLVESEDDIRVISAPRSPRSIPVQTIGELFRFRPNGHLGHRVRVQGTYLGGPADGWLAIQDQTGGVFIETEQSLADLQPGDRLELIGFPTRRAQTLWLENAEILERMSGTPPGPTVKSFAEGIDRPGQLARLTGDVIGLPRPGENAWVVTLSDQGGNSFDVHVSPAADRYPTEWREGAQLTVTGIAEAYTRSGVSHDLFPFPSDLRVHVRSLDDVVVERAPPWHTSKVFAALLMRTLVVIALVLGAVLMVVILLARKNAALRETRRRLHEAREELARRFSARTGEWQQELAARHAAEADFALLTAERIRLARELHDTLEQSMASVALQLDAVHGFYHEQPKQALVLLEQATHTLRESQAEVRRSVWNLRSLKLEETTLPDALDQLSESLHATQGPAIEFACEGSPWTLPPLVASHLFRIAQEAVTNALKHADARRIRLLLAFEPTLLELSIQDDGRGFATETVLEEGHFGLAGMQERATALEADLRIVSSADTGTSLHVRVFRDRLGPFPP